MCLVLLLFFLPVVLPLRCYEGSKGVINGVETSNFRETTCDENMIHCFESYSDDWSDVTASCQTPSTDDKLLSKGCVHHTDVNVTVCCCDTDLCNLPTKPATLPPSEAVATSPPPPRLHPSDNSSFS